MWISLPTHGGQLAPPTPPPTVGAATFTNLFTFSGDRVDGGVPCSPLVEGADGCFYGTTQLGGSAGWGTVFKVTSEGRLTTLCWLSDQTVGTSPTGLVVGLDGNLYGGTSSGGAYQCGTLYRVTPRGQVSVLHAFTNTGDGYGPDFPLILANDGSFYGVAYSKVFHITPSGGYTVIHTFDSADVGSVMSMILGSDGDLYGTTKNTIFKMTPTGVMTTIYTFTEPKDGSDPTGLVEGPDGCFYGSTSDISLYGSAWGTIFRVTPQGRFTTLYSFNNTDGERPQAGFIFGADGGFYGTTLEGGANNGGTIFRVGTDGSLVTLYGFRAGGGCAMHVDSPGVLTQGKDGCIYGTTSAGGSRMYGTVFKLTPAIAPATNAPHISPTQGTFDSPHTVTITDDTPDATIYYTTDGSQPTAMSTPYHRPFVVSKSSVIKAVAISPHFALSAVSMTTISIKVPVAIEAHFLWTRTSGAAAVWTVLSDGTYKSSPAYGPYGTWTAKAITDGPGGLPKLLWTDGAGRFAVWLVRADGSYVSTASFGPYGDWNAVGLAARGDGRLCILLQRPNGAGAVWTLDGRGAFASSSPAFGPYGAWKVTGFAVGHDNVTRLLWHDGAHAAIWKLNDDGSFGTSSLAFTGLLSMITSIAAGSNGETLAICPIGIGTTWTFGSDFSIQHVDYGSGGDSELVAVGSDGVPVMLGLNGGCYGLFHNGGTYGLPTMSLYGPYAGWSIAGIAAP